jgi:hypothetical protein
MTFLADTHVHIYPCHSPEALLQAGVSHLQATASASGDLPCVLALTETAQDHWFASLTSGRHRLPEGTTIRLLEDNRSAHIRLSDTEVWVIAGRQIVTRERLEILALGTSATFEEGQDIDTVLKQVIEADAIPVLAWAPGKWLGKRAAVVTRVIDTYSDRLWIGDSSLRCTLWPQPEGFRSSSRPVLAGSDPLPVPGEERQTGRFGVQMKAAFDPDAPLASLRRALEGPADQVKRIGRRNSPLNMLLRMRRHAARKSSEAS